MFKFRLTKCQLAWVATIENRAQVATQNLLDVIIEVRSYIEQALKTLLGILLPTIRNIQRLASIFVLYLAYHRATCCNSHLPD